MASHTYLSPEEFRSLEELGKGILHGSIPGPHAVMLVACGFAYKLLGHIRITTLGRTRLKMGEPPTNVRY
jgi:hypothetical protein